MGRGWRYRTREEEAKLRAEEQAAFRVFLVAVAEGLTGDERLFVTQAVWGGRDNPDVFTDNVEIRLAQLHLGDTVAHSEQVATLSLTHIGENALVRLDIDWNKNQCPRFGLKKDGAAVLLVAAWREHVIRQRESMKARVTYLRDREALVNVAMRELGFSLVADGLPFEVDVRRAEDGTPSYLVTMKRAALSADQVKRLLALLREGSPAEVTT